MRKKLSTAFIIVLIVGMSITGLFSLKITTDFYLNNLEDKLITNGSLISDIFTKSYNPSKNNYDSLAKEFSNISKSRITIIAANGVVIGESDTESKYMQNHSNRAEVKEALSGRIGKSLRLSDTEKKQMLYVAVPTLENNHVKFIIRMAVSLTNIESIEKKFFIYIGLATLAGLLSSSIIAYSFTKRITRPVKEMTIISSQIAGGNYEKRIKPMSNDEIGELAETFNYMAETLQFTINDLSDKKNKLEAILKSMQNGVIAVDNSKRIMLVNPAAVCMFGLKENVVGKHIMEVIRNAELEDIIQNRQDENREIVLNYPEKRVLKVKTALIEGSQDSIKSLGIVVVIQDVTELKKLEQMRTDFVANVSHELKTPLTSIKGFTETLKSGAINDPSASEKFLDIINIETDRLTRLINDILTLSDLENRKQNIALDKVNINTVMEEIEDIMTSLSRQKKISLSFDMEKNIPLVSGNCDKVKQLLINLIDNAIKYTPECGKVKVRTFSADKKNYIEVSDTGIGISEEHLPRLFERFYRVDKGRSRALGGTGLGLAIVKHIVMTMNGDIDVKSQLGKGSTFTISIPYIEIQA